ncbi:hypothetical protein POK33_38350 [Burkholderia cenocepacia]|uniref:hypothetical protein n=1 Tax=Burkholderia cenocepacia TaxID=95486 RepID=UPI0023B99D3E|nr:hypothetical protein [Burkholderia cenocepacia]MDF0506618.1 hypothetical protein [Burkholderia cenocepacia]
MDKKIEMVVAALALLGGLLVVSGLITHLAFVEQIGIPLDKQAFVGGVLTLVAVALHWALGGTWFPRCGKASELQ